ncbi:MAG TPA: cytochrome P450 [Gaiellaceae bacterium]
MVGRGSLNSTANADPWAYFEELREGGEVVWDDEMNAWLVTSYEACKEMARGDDTFWRPVYIPNDDRPMLGLSREALAQFMGSGGSRVIFLLEGEEHHQLHRWWMRTFSPNVLAGWREAVIRPIVQAQIDRFAARGRAELVEDLASRVPPRVIGAVMGLPWQDDEWLEHLLGLVMARLELIQRQADAYMDPEVVERGLAAGRELSEILLPFVRERRSGTGDDLISRLWADAPSFYEGEFDELDILGNVKTMFDGGAKSTVYAISNALYLLLVHPGLQDELRAGGSKAVERFTEESLRLFGPVQFRPRVALRDVELAGVQIRRGEMAIAVNIAANRDPRKYDCPAEIDLNRPAPRDHLSFYAGQRSCTGQALARAELEEVTTMVLDQLADLRLDADADPPEYQELLMRRWAPLHVRFAPVA